MNREELNFFIQKSPFMERNELRVQIEKQATVALIQKPSPQTLLVPVKDPINGGEFLGGEVLVTSSIVQVDGVNGWAMVMDDNPELAQTVAIIDGAYAAGIFVDAIQALCQKGRQYVLDEKEKERLDVTGTKVEFDLL